MSDNWSDDSGKKSCLICSGILTGYLEPVIITGVVRYCPACLLSMLKLFMVNLLYIKNQSKARQKQTSANDLNRIDYNRTHFK